MSVEFEANGRDRDCNDWKCVREIVVSLLIEANVCEWFYVSHNGVHEMRGIANKKMP